MTTPSRTTGTWQKLNSEPISHERARKAAHQVIGAAFKNPAARPRFSVPAEAADHDVTLLEYIDQQEAAAYREEALKAENADLRRQLEELQIGLDKLVEERNFYRTEMIAAKGGLLSAEMIMDSRRERIEALQSALKAREQALQEALAHFACDDTCNCLLKHGDKGKHIRGRIEWLLP